jgi:hypothetical protein
VDLLWCRSTAPRVLAALVGTTGAQALGGVAVLVVLDRPADALQPPRLLAASVGAAGGRRIERGWLCFGPPGTLQTLSLSSRVAQGRGALGHPPGPPPGADGSPWYSLSSRASNTPSPPVWRRGEELLAILQDRRLALTGPWYGPGALANGAFSIRYSIFLNVTNATAEWAIPEGEGCHDP